MVSLLFLIHVSNRWFDRVINFFYHQWLGIDYDINSYVNKFKSTLDRLYELYAVIIQPEFVGLLLRVSLDLDSSSSSSVGVDEYLSYQFETEDDFHIIQWWKNHSLRFPVLAKTAKDILAISVTIIAPKPAFSA
ncbi:Zinc finger BED domain-containing protein RICESLEEPER 3, partial [Bienertia sinuspersici]